MATLTAEIPEKKRKVDQTVKYDEVRIVFVKPDGNADR